MSQPLSLRPSDAQAGGFLDDVDVVLTSLRFVVWDYQGKGEPTVALKVDMLDAEERVHEQYYSAGSPDKLIPNDDGRAVLPLGEATGLNASCNAIAFLTSLVNAGFPEDKIGNDIGVFDGTVAHVNQVAQPKRTGLKTPQKEGKTYLLVTKIVRLPWEAAPAAAPKAAKGAPAPKNATPKPVAAAPAAVAKPAPVASPAPAPGAEPTEEISMKARMTMMQVLSEKGPLAKGKLPTEAFRALANDADRNAIVTLVFQEPFLQAAAAEGVITYDGATVALA